MHSEEAEKPTYMVACGQCHTLALLGENLYVLGSGLDRQPRLNNFIVKKLRADHSVLSPARLPHPHA